MQYYLITIRKPQKKDYVSQDEIREVLVHLHNNNIYLIDGTEEYHGMYKQLHYHGIIKVPKSFSYSKFTKVGDMRINYKSFPPSDYNKILYYIYKHNPAMDYHHQTIITNYYNHHYGWKNYHNS